MGATQKFRLSYAKGLFVLLISLSSQTVAKVHAEGKPPSGGESEIGVSYLSLQDAAPARWGIQGQSQGAGTPNSIGLSGFFPLWVGADSIVFLDTLANVDLPDIGNVSSLTHAPVVGATVSTSTRLGYRWLNSDRSWMLGVTGGYDSRPLTTGQPETGISVSDSQTLFFQQIAAGLEAYSKVWHLKAYALLPIGNTMGYLNDAYDAGALTTFGCDVGFAISRNLQASVGYYYQNSDLKASNGSGVSLNLDYAISDSLSAGVTLSYDDIFDTRVSANVKYRLGRLKARKDPSSATGPLQALSESPGYRAIRIHDQCALSTCSKAENTTEATEESKSPDSPETTNTIAAKETTTSDPPSKSDTPVPSDGKTINAAASSESVGKPAQSKSSVAVDAGASNRPVSAPEVSRFSESSSPMDSGGGTRLSQTRAFLRSSDGASLNSVSEDSGSSPTIESRMDSGGGTRLSQTRAFLRSSDGASLNSVSEDGGSSPTIESRMDSGGGTRLGQTRAFLRSSDGASLNSVSEDSGSSPTSESRSSTVPNETSVLSRPIESGDSTRSSSDSSSSRSSDSDNSRRSSSDSSSSRSSDSDNPRRSSSDSSSSRSSDSDNSIRSSSDSSSSRSSDSDNSRRSSSDSSSSRSSDSDNSRRQDARSD